MMKKQNAYQKMPEKCLPQVGNNFFFLLLKFCRFFSFNAVHTAYSLLLMEGTYVSGRIQDDKRVLIVACLGQQTIHNIKYVNIIRGKSLRS